MLARAELRTAEGDAGEARTLLEAAHTTFVSLGARPALARADVLAACLAAAHATPPTYPAGLTAREVEVLHLVAQGLTDAQVAERLFLGTRTVNQHLRNIYNKLGVSSRAAATRFVTEHGLLP
jgi:DNA-binding NarL/FixJ family response regulator